VRSDDAAVQDEFLRLCEKISGVPFPTAG